MQKTAFLSLGIVALAMLSGWASVVVALDQELTKRQKVWQALLAWVFPIVGPILVLTVRHFARRQKDRSAGDSSLAVNDRHYISKGYF